MAINYFKMILQSEDMQQIATSVRKCIKAMHTGGDSYPAIVNQVNHFHDSEILNENTLKSFLKRTDTSRSNRSNTLELLYNFLRGQEKYLNEAGRVAFTSEIHILKNIISEDAKRLLQDEAEHVFGGLICSWMDIGSQYIKKYQRELQDDYILVRKSVRDEDFIVISDVKIRAVGERDIQITHYHYDRNNDIRISIGFIVPTDHNHFAVLNIESGSSIEFLSIKKPIQEKYKRLIGFITTINSEGTLVNARVVLQKKSDVEFLSEPRVKIRDHSENEEMRKILEYLAEDKAQTIPDKTEALYNGEKNSR